LQQEAIQAMIQYLLPLALVTTPNIPEAEVLTGLSIRTLQDREEAAKRIHQMGSTYVVMKGGHDDASDQVIDLVYDGGNFIYLESKRIETRHTHGTGCTFAAAITAELAKGNSVAEAVQTAKQFIQAAIEDQLGFGAGHGPTNHFAYQRRKRGEGFAGN
jgi:hydroxymethylpyrimidine/phosphomethylpyrimidine kinase